MVDYVNRLIDLYKGKHVFFINRTGENTVKDYYTKLTLPISLINNCTIYGRRNTSSPVQEFESYDENKLETAEQLITKAADIKTYLCKDIIIDGNDILAVFEDDNGDVFSLALWKAIIQCQFVAYYRGEMLYQFLLEKTPLDEGDSSIISCEQFDTFKKEYAIAQNTLRSQTNRIKQEERRIEQERKNAIISKYGQEMGTKIFEHQLALGMTPEMCIESIGYPSHYYKSITSFGNTLIYSYAYMNLLFCEDKLVQIQEGI